MDSYVIKVHPQDELTSVIDKIIKTEARRIYLLIPEQSFIAQHVLNLRLLKREADSLGKEIIAVSASPRVQSLALKASLQVHQETEDLVRGAEASKQEGAGPPSASVIHDIVGPNPLRQLADGEADDRKKIHPKKFAEKKSDKLNVPDKKFKSSESPVLKVNKYNIEKNEDKKEAQKDKAIVDFWTKRRHSLSSEKIKSFLPDKSLISRPGLVANGAKVMKYILAAFVAVSIVLAGITFYSVLPKAKIYIISLVEDVTLEIEIKGDASISNIEEGGFVIPTQIFEKSINDSKKISTSGEKELKEKASGIIKIFNAYSSAPQTLVETTRFVSEKGKLFRTTETIVVPGAEVKEGKIVPSSTTVNVIAASPGEEYNIGSSSFSIPGFKGTPKYLAFYGESEEKMSGGRIGSVRVVSKSDYKDTEQKLKKELEERANQELALSMQEEFIIPSGASSLSEVQIESSKNIGDEASELNMSGSISVRAFAIREIDVIRMLESDFEKRFPGKKIVSNGDKVTYNIIETNFDEGILNFKVFYSTRAAIEISESDIRFGVLGKEEKDVRIFLSSYSGIKEARVTFWPFWVNKIPDDLSKIEVIIKP